MAGDTVITIIGNLTADPELRYTQNGKAVANGTIASTPRSFNRTTSEWEDGEALFMRFSAWAELGEHVAGSLSKGMRVVAVGRLKQRSYDTKEGEKRTVIELELDEIGPSLKYATAQVTRATAGGGQQQAAAPQGQYGAPQGQQGPPPGAWQGAPQQQPQGYPAPQQGAPQAPPQQQPQQGPPQPQYGAPQQGYGNPAQQEPWTTGPAAYGDDTPF